MAPSRSSSEAIYDSDSFRSWLLIAPMPPPAAPTAETAAATNTPAHGRILGCRLMAPTSPRLHDDGTSGKVFRLIPACQRVRRPPARFPALLLPKIGES